jgi:hypothetical protein
VIDKPESRRLVGGINRLSIIHFNNGDPLLSFGSSSSFPLADSFSGVLADFLPTLQGDRGE